VSAANSTETQSEQSGSKEKQKKQTKSDIYDIFGSQTHRPKGNAPLKKLKITLLSIFFLGSVVGCSATSLQCEVDGDSSYINLNTTPAVLGQGTRALAELCSFNQETPGVSQPEKGT